MTTFLDNYLDVLKSAPLDVLRYTELLEVLDERSSRLEAKSQQEAEDIIAQAMQRRPGSSGGTSPAMMDTSSSTDLLDDFLAPDTSAVAVSPGTGATVPVDKFRSLRATQGECLALTEEKMALADLAENHMLQYIERLEKDLELFGEELGPANIPPEVPSEDNFVFRKSTPLRQQTFPPVRSSPPLGVPNVYRQSTQPPTTRSRSGVPYGLRGPSPMTGGQRMASPMGSLPMLPPGRAAPSPSHAVVPDLM